jgi:hypothetical protein
LLLVAHRLFIVYGQVKQGRRLYVGASARCLDSESPVIRCLAADRDGRRLQLTSAMHLVHVPRYTPWSHQVIDIDIAR